MQGPWHEREMEFDDSMTKGSNSNSNDNATLYNNLKNHHIVKPLFNGFLTGEAHALLLYSFRSIVRSIVLPMAQSDPVIKRKLPKYILEIPLTRLKMDLLVLSAHTTAALGVYEILTKKYRKANNGMPLTLYQEAWCGFTSGAAAAFVFQPIFMSQNRVGMQNFTYRNWFTTCSHIVRNEGALTFWRGSGLNMSRMAIVDMGMLASYRPSRDYLIESRGLSDQDAQISASIFSGFFSSVLCHPCDFLLQIKAGVQKQYASGDKNAYRYIPHYVSRVLGSPHFYSRFLYTFNRHVAFCVLELAEQ